MGLPQTTMRPMVDLISTLGVNVYRPALTTNAGASHVDNDGIRPTSQLGGT